MTLYDLIRDFWAGLAAAGTGLIWLMRLEAKALSNEREIRRLWKQRREDLDAAQHARQETNNLLTEVRADVKQIIIMWRSDR